MTTESKPAKKRERNSFFSNPFEGRAGIESEGVFQTFDANQIANRVLSKSDENFAIIEKVIENTGAQKEIDEGHELIEGLINNTREYIAKEKERLEKLREDKDMLGMKAKYKKPFRKKITFYNPQTNMLLIAIQEYDQLMQEADVCWLCGVIDREQRKTLKQLVARKINDFSNRIVNLAKKSRRLFYDEIEAKKLVKKQDAEKKSMMKEQEKKLLEGKPTKEEAVEKKAVAEKEESAAA